MEDQEKDNKPVISIEDVSNEVVVTIRCLSAVPEDVEILLAEIAKREEELLASK